VLPSHCEQSLWQGEQSNFFRSTFEEPCGVATQHTTHYEAATHHPTQASREATPSSDKEVPSDDATHHAQDGVRSGNEQCKQHPLGTATTTSHNEDHMQRQVLSKDAHILRQEAP
jgi:hypothetical protein